MTLLIKSILIFITSFAFVFFRTLNMKAIVSDRIIAATIWGMLVSATWLFSIYLGVSSLIQSEYLIFIPYVVGGAVGNILAMYKKHNRG